MRERGFAFLGLLGSPWVWLAIGAALLSLTGWQLWESWQREARVRGEFNAFVEAVKARGEERERETAAKEAKDRETFKAIKARYSADLARRDADLRRLRDSAPTRPDRSEVPLIACGPQGTDAPPGERLSAVPLSEYRELEARAYDDALRLSRLQAWVAATGHPVE